MGAAGASSTWWVAVVCFVAGCAVPVATDAGSAGLVASREAGPTGVVREFDLFLAADTGFLVQGNPTFTLRFAEEAQPAGSIPGPEIRVTQGDTVRVRLHAGDHTIHWHGVRLPWAMDGVPGGTQALGPGSFTYEFVARDAGTFWYHCHVAAPEHVDLGMFGAFIVEPQDAREDPPFDREVTLFLHEMDTRSFALNDFKEEAGEGNVDPRHLTNVPPNARSAHDHAAHNAGTFADVQSGNFAYTPRYHAFMINGKSWPETDPVPITMGETIRMRIVNAGQLTHTMHLHGHRFVVTHKDGALLPAPYLADTIGLFPGERYDVYVRGDNPGTWDFHDHGGAWGVGAFAAQDGVFPGGMMTMLHYEDWTPPARLPAPS